MVVIYLLLVAAGGATLAAWILDDVRFGYLAICLSLPTVLATAVGMWVRRRGIAAPGARNGHGGEEPSSANPVEAATPAPQAAGAAAAIADPSQHASESESTELIEASGSSAMAQENVCVVPGRRRYHRHDCRLLEGAQSETITVAEALDEGFTPCTKCRPGA